MRFSSMLVAAIFNFLSTFCQQVIGCSFPIDISSVFPQQRVMRDSRIFAPIGPALSTTERTVFGPLGCVVYGYPSTGGVLIKEAADLVDMLFLSVPRSYASQRSPSADEEDRFCNLMRRTGAKFWPSKEEWIEVKMEIREITEEEEKVMVYGWPTDGVGVWVLRYGSASQMPRDFGRMSFAMNMDERIQMMREYGATFVEDITQVKELCDS
ncbi:hypothetical protein N7536_007303 [Penicillium majusculum]|uniref:Uncharacterized protein n=1 Tax=Penicillium solitum TaxID=60172 RepID=A0A1V6RLY4_9EURO|nr:uncharacterized protein PENSOL_c002G04457 [Penicillium solitum]KAJ5696891.1 hypothetical protein N7536_007303 [Penicillium majusculum]OQE02636.1 hypothetical protein PENSOL_c002G04457 [Penicillium solitum]